MESPTVTSPLSLAPLATSVAKSGSAATRWAAFRQGFPVTTRGVLVALFSLYLIVGPARLQSDMVAAIVGYSLLSLVVAASAATLLQAARFRDSLRASISAGPVAADIEVPLAQLPTRVVTRLQRIAMVPLTALEAMLNFEKPVPHARHIITGRSADDRVLIEDITFPHRGEWWLSSLRFSVGDFFGLSSLQWEDRLTVEGVSVVVRPRPRAEHNVPVVSSAVRTGDALSDTVERQGDPFDLKQYNPADGMRRILWKVFAKRGELVARHPERAVSPEGQVICFVIADEHDDVVCAEAKSYAEALHELDLQLWFGCEGQDHRDAARSPRALEQLLVDSVWDAAANRGQALVKEVAVFLARLRTTLQHSRIERIVVFISQERCGSLESLQTVQAALDELSSAGINVVLVPVKVAPALSANGVHRSWLQRLLLEEEQPLRRFDEPVFRRFLSICATRGWEVIL